MPSIFFGQESALSWNALCVRGRVAAGTDEKWGDGWGLRAPAVTDAQTAWLPQRVGNYMEDCAVNSLTAAGGGRSYTQSTRCGSSLGLIDGMTVW
jgi:hypothetical protein